MSETKVKLLEAAEQVFSRYGVKRTSMADVASAAGVSRQTLYSVFKNKDELLAEAMRVTVQRIYETLEQEWATAKTVGEIVEVYFEHSVRGPFEMLQKLPDLRDLIDGVGEATTRVAKAAEAKKIEYLAQQLTPFAANLEKSGNSPEMVANLIVRSTNDFKYNSTDRDALERLLTTLKSSIVALAEG